MFNFPVPDAPPSYVTVINIRKRSIDIRLGPVPTDNQHGVILGYHVVYNSSSGEIRNTTVPGNQSEALVTGLMPFTVYDISVAAFTRLGVGPFTTINVTTAQQGSVRSTRFAEFEDGLRFIFVVGPSFVFTMFHCLGTLIKWPIN